MMRSTPGTVPGWRTDTLARLAAAVLPWLCFAAMALWAWGPRDLAHTVPHYGDALEHVSGAAWIDQAVREGQNPLVYPLNFFPEGWQLGSHAGGTVLFVLLWPFARLFGVTLALNLAEFLTCVIAFGGVLFVARPRLGTLAATVVALAYTFWAMRWDQLMDGRLNIMLASALLPWLIFCAEHALAAPQRRRRWLAGGGLLWALTIMASMYFAFIGGILLAAWLLFMQTEQPRSWRTRGLDLAGICLVALLASAPWLILNARANAITDPDFYKIEEVAFWGASLNAFPAPFLLHPWLARVARLFYTGTPFEQATANFGLVGLALASGGTAIAWRQRAWRPVLIVTPVCLVLSLGLILQWNGRSVETGLLRPLNAAIWSLGHAVKPGFFPGAEPPPRFSEAVPLPSLLLSAIVPLWERGRVFARYALAAGLCIFLLAGLALSHIRRPWLRGALAALLLLEIVPPRLDLLPFPPQTHPAFTWLSEQDLGDQGILDMVAGHPHTPVIATGGPVLLATLYHHKPTVAGASGVTPRHHAFLGGWLSTHEHSYWDADFAPILRAYRVKYILLQMQGDAEQEIWREAQANKELRPVRCFPAPDQATPWDWPICVLEVLPAPSADFNVLLHDGWSGMEPWGVWAEGTESFAQWVSTAKVPYRLSMSVFPQCVPGKQQTLQLLVQGTEVASHQWQGCDPWETTVDIPESLVRIGANDLVLRAGYAASPPGTEGGNDTRRLSVGFSKLRADRAGQAAGG